MKLRILRHSPFHPGVAAARGLCWRAGSSRAFMVSPQQIESFCLHGGWKFSFTLGPPGTSPLKMERWLAPAQCLWVGCKLSFPWGHITHREMRWGEQSVHQPCAWPPHPLLPPGGAGWLEAQLSPRSPLQPLRGMGSWGAESPCFTRLVQSHWWWWGGEEPQLTVGPHLSTSLGNQITTCFFQKLKDQLPTRPPVKTSRTLQSPPRYKSPSVPPVSCFQQKALVS